MHAREVYEQLSQVGSKEERELFRERIEEDIDPSMELCNTILKWSMVVKFLRSCCSRYA